MKIGILGVGNVGGALGRGWARAGHEVRFGVRKASDPKVSRLVEEAGGGAAAVAVAEAAAWGEVVTLAVPWSACEEVLAAAGDLSGKVLLDCTNPLARDLSGLVVGADASAGERVAAWAAGARVVKIFNTTGAGNMADPRYGDEATTMLYCGDDPAAKETAAGLAADLGFDPVDAGPLVRARLLEPFALLWISLAYGQGRGPNIAWKLLAR